MPDSGDRRAGGALPAVSQPLDRDAPAKCLGIAKENADPLRCRLAKNAKSTSHCGMAPGPRPVPVFQRCHF